MQAKHTVTEQHFEQNWGKEMRKIGQDEFYEQETRNAKKFANSNHNRGYNIGQQFARAFTILIDLFYAGKINDTTEQNRELAMRRTVELKNRKREERRRRARTVGVVDEFLRRVNHIVSIEAIKT